MAIRQQYANEELIHKLRSMLNDLPTLRTRAMKKLEHWREAAIQRLLARQRELEKTLLDKFERLEFDTQLFVEKTERKKAQQQRRWQSEPFDFLNKSEIDRISTNLRSIREELEQSKLILDGSTINENIASLLSNDRYGENLSTKTALHNNTESSTSNDLGLELKRVLEICTSPQTSLSADELSSMQSLDHPDFSYDQKPKQINAVYSPKLNTQVEDINRRHARIITNIPTEQFENEKNEIPLNNNDSKLFSFDTFDESVKRVERLREIRKNLRNKYDEHTQQNDDIPQSVNISIERVNPPSSMPIPTTITDSNINQSDKDKARDRRYRSRTAELNQKGAVDNQIYGYTISSPSQTKQHAEHYSNLNKNRAHTASFRRSCEDIQDKQLQLRRHLDYSMTNSNETWLEIGQEHWTSLLENGWRPTINTPGVNLVSFTDSDDYGTRKRHEDRPPIDLYELVSRNEYVSLFEQLQFAYARTVDLGNEFWRFLEIHGSQHLCLYHQLNKQFIMYKPDTSLLCFPWPYDGIVDVSWSNTTNTWAVATQTRIIICNRSFSKILQSINIIGDWPKRITSCRSSIFHTYKISTTPKTHSSNVTYQRVSYKDRPQFLLERYDYKLNSICKHILESSIIWDIEADDLTEHLAVLCDIALLLFDYQLNLLRQIEVTGFKVSTDHFGGWLVSDYNASCIWQIRRNEYLKANKILHVERPWSAILDQTTWTLILLSETQQRAKRLLFFSMKNIPLSLLSSDMLISQSQMSVSSSSSAAESLL